MMPSLPELQGRKKKRVEEKKKEGERGRGTGNRPIFVGIQVAAGKVNTDRGEEKEFDEECL